MNNIAVITSGYFPVPDSRGGAVEHLVTLLLKGGERSEKNIHFEVLSCWDKGAISEAEVFKKSSFTFVKTPLPIRLLDKGIYQFARIALRKEKAFSYRYVLQRFHYLACVKRALLHNSYDAILVENHPLLFTPFRDNRVFRKYEGRVLFHLHNEVTGLFGCEKQLRSVKRVLGISQYICRSYLDVLPGFDSTKLRVLRNCLEIEEYGTHQAVESGRLMRSEYGIAQDESVILYSGRLSPEKGVRELLLAFKKMHRTSESVRLVIAGSTYYSSGTTSTYEKELKCIASSLGNAVIFTGYVSHDRMPALYAMADVCVVPSMWEEPACMSALEAIASGKPLIATKSGGMVEYINESFAIMLNRGKGFTDRLAEALASLLQDDNARLRLEAAARKARDGFSSIRYFERFAELAEEILSESRHQEGIGL